MNSYVKPIVNVDSWPPDTLYQGDRLFNENIMTVEAIVVYESEQNIANAELCLQLEDYKSFSKEDIFDVNTGND